MARAVIGGAEGNGALRAGRLAGKVDKERSAADNHKKPVGQAAGAWMDRQQMEMAQ